MEGEQEVNEHLGYVYFIGAPSVHRIKIGFASFSPDGRYKELNVGSPVRLERLALMRGPHSLEQELHGRFRKECRKGEWFRSSERLMAFIESDARDWRELLDEEAAAAAKAATANHRVMIDQLRRQARRTEDHYDECYMAGIDPETLPVPTTDPLPSKRNLPKPRRLRYGPLQEMLDKIAARESK